MEVSWNGGTPKSSIYKWIFHYKPSILGYLQFISIYGNPHLIITPINYSYIYHKP